MSVYWKHLHMLQHKTRWEDSADYTIKQLPVGSAQCLLEE